MIQVKRVLLYRNSVRNHAFKLNNIIISLSFIIYVCKVYVKNTGKLTFLWYAEFIVCQIGTACCRIIPWRSLRKKRWTFACLMICKLLHFWWIANWRNCTFVSGSNRYSDMYSHALSVVTMRSYNLAVCSNIVDTTNCDRPVAEDDRPSLKKPMPFKNLSSRQLHFCRLSIFLEV